MSNISTNSLLNQMDLNRQITSDYGLNNIAKNNHTGKKNLADNTRTAEEFEAMFLSKMFNILFETLQPNPLFGGSYAEKMYQSMMADEYSKIISISNKTQIADTIKAQILRLQEVTQNGK